MLSHSTWPLQPAVRPGIASDALAEKWECTPQLQSVVSYRTGSDADTFFHGIFEVATWQSAFEFLELMKESRVQATTVTCNTVPW